MSEEAEKVNISQEGTSVIESNDTALSLLILDSENKTASSTEPPVLATYSGDTNDIQQQSQATTKTPTKKLEQLKLPDFIRNNWDPLNSADWDLEKPSQNCLHRIKKLVKFILIFCLIQNFFVALLEIFIIYIKILHQVYVLYLIAMI